MHISPRNECFCLFLWPEDKSIRRREGECNKCSKSKRDLFGPTWQKHLENVIYNARRREQRPATTAHTLSHSHTNWNLVVNFGRSHQEPLNLKVERHRQWLWHHLPPISHRSHSSKRTAHSQRIAPGLKSKPGGGVPGIAFHIPYFWWGQCSERRWL